MNNSFSLKKNIGSSIRRSQVITTFGPGALVNLELGSLMAMGIDAWPKANFDDFVYEERLQKRLKVRFFRQPPSADSFPKGLPYRRFPRWLFCPKCRMLKRYEDWVINDKRKFPTVPKCTTCTRKGLVSMSFLIACRRGHLNDFPWVQWVHRDKIPCMPNPALSYTTSLAGAGLAGSRIECLNCHSKRSLQGAFSPDAFKFKCSGFKPWSKDQKSEDCNEEIVTVQRGGSNVYFPRIVSSITIPPYTNPLFDKITNDKNWSIFSSSDFNFDQSVKEQVLAQIAKNIGYTLREVKSCVENIEKMSSDAEAQSEEDFRFDEFQAFHGNFDMSANNKRDFNIAPGNAGCDYSQYGIKDIILVKSLREVRALVGFTRLRPFEPDIEYASDDEKKESSEMVALTDREGHPSGWKPAIEVRGEGIFLALDSDKIDLWSKRENVKYREGIINRNLEESCRRRHAIFKPTSAKYVLLHTLSHLLIRQLSFESGYSGASLRERIYCNLPGNKNIMQGILIYTAAGDADGTLGGLVRQAKPERFKAVLNSMVETARWCANDPLCIESRGQGFESLNLSACYACALLPETSCEEYNRFLDRAFLTGTPTEPDLGFF
ncbi:MAG: DUF1998 domain-containing protein [Patescibacteria group bacterium]|nr:DUF1998 domain-containing protein [Patescibacteria group bacterium]